MNIDDFLAENDLQKEKFGNALKVTDIFNYHFLHSLFYVIYLVLSVTSFSNPSGRRGMYYSVYNGCHINKFMNADFFSQHKIYCI